MGKLKLDYDEEIIERTTNATSKSNNDSEDKKTNIEEKSEKSKIHKCPDCGAALKSFETNCSYCRMEIREIRVSKSLDEFIKGIEKIQSRTMPKFETKESLLKKLIGEDFKKRDEKEAFKEDFISEKENDLAEYIKNYSVPNSKEDLTEFMILATSNLDVKNGFDGVVQKAWIIKMNQIMDKAKLSVKNSSDLAVIRELYDNKKNEIKTKKHKNILLIAGGVSAYILLMVLLFNPLLALGIALILITVFIYLYSKINGRYIKMIDKEFNETTVNGICIVLIVLALIFGIMGIVQGSQKPEGYKNYYNESIQKYDVELVIKFRGNLFFSKYNVEFKLYDNSETLHHGVGKTIMLKLPKGKHKLEFTGDGMIERVTLDVKGNMRVTYELSCHADEIKVRELSADYLDKES